MIADRARARQLRRELDLRDVLLQLQREGWSPRRCSCALDLPEAFLVRVLTGRTPTRAARAEPMVRSLAVELDDRPAVASVLHDLVAETRGGLWAVDWWPLPFRVVALLCRRQLTRRHGEAQWEPTTLGVDVDRFRSARFNAR